MSECAEVMVVEGERGAEGVDSGESICVSSGFLQVYLFVFFLFLVSCRSSRFVLFFSWEAKKRFGYCGVFLSPISPRLIERVYIRSRGFIDGPWIDDITELQS